MRKKENRIKLSSTSMILTSIMIETNSLKCLGWYCGEAS